MGMNTAYTPQPGTIAARAVAAVLALEEGETIANVVLAERLGQGSSFVIAGMEAPVRYGLVERVMSGRLVSWRRGNGQARVAPQPLDDEVDDAPIVQRIVPAAKSSGVSLLDMPAWTAPVPMHAPGACLPPPDPDAREGPEPEPAQRRRRATTARPAPSTCHNGTPSAVTPLIAPYLPPAGGAGMRIALWSDGQLQIQRSAADAILFTADETRAIVRYLERMAEASE